MMQVDQEMEVFSALACWVQADAGARAQHFPCLLGKHLSPTNDVGHACCPVCYYQLLQILLTFGAVSGLSGLSHCQFCDAVLDRPVNEQQ